MAVLERLTFLQQLPVLLKGTSDDDTPCPGYLYEEMAKISHESPGSSQCLLEYLLNRLQNNSCHVKFKVLKILLYLCSHGPDLFIQDLRRNAIFIQEAAGIGGPPDPLHGISLYQKVRSTAQELIVSLFIEEPPHIPNGVPAKEKTQTGMAGRSPIVGMGSQAFRPHTLQGFGFSQDKASSGSAGEALLSGFQRAAVAVTQAVLIGAGSQAPGPGDQTDNSYQPVAVPLRSGHLPAGKADPGTRSNRGQHRSGVPGGGWDDHDSGHSSQDSMQEKSSDAGSKTGSDGPSPSSNRGSAETAERAEAPHPGDCLQEAQLVRTVTRGHNVFLTQEEVQHFIRGCSGLNCEVVFEMLNRALDDDNACVKLRSMCAIASLMTSDLLSHDHMLAVAKTNLLKLSRGSAGPVTDKAKKILLQFEALTRNSPKHRASQASLSSSSLPRSPLDLLNDAVPHSTEEDLLTPSNVRSAPDLVKPACCGVSAQTSVPEEAQIMAAETLPTSQHCADEASQTIAHSRLPQTIAHSCLPQTIAHSRLPLFDGMELVTPVRSTTISCQTSHQPTMMAAGSADTVSQHRTAKPGLTSAFSFLNT